MINEIFLILATFGVIFFRVIQTKNVVGHHYLAAFITPYAIAIAEVSGVLLVVSTGWYSIPYVGTGGAIGAVTAMYIHKRYIR